MNRISILTPILDKLSDTQFNLVTEIATALSLPVESKRNENSDVITDGFLQDFGDTLKTHHVMSKEPFTKDKFEYAMVRILLRGGRKAELARKGYRGHDITVDGERWSLKTQADAGIKELTIHISKFMELGGGKWETEADLVGLRDLFFEHMVKYDRIFTLRAFRQGKLLKAGYWHYELVEIPKMILLQAINGKFEMKHDSKQNPKPGYCTVTDQNGTLFQLYFDGGSERKLQIRSILKRLCMVHAIWTLPTLDSHS